MKIVLDMEEVRKLIIDHINAYTDGDVREVAFNLLNPVEFAECLMKGDDE